MINNIYKNYTHVLEES